MALINCKECKKEISSLAKICPHCGFKIKKPFKKSTLFVLVFILLTVIGIAGKFTYDKYQTEKVISAVKHEIEGHMKDPSSVIYKNIKTKINKNQERGNTTSVCLEYNAKNSMGGYTGFEQDSCTFSDGRVTCFGIILKQTVPLDGLTGVMKQLIDQINKDAIRKQCDF